VVKALDLRSDPPVEVAIKLLPRGEFVRGLPVLPCFATALLPKGFTFARPALRLRGALAGHARACVKGQ